MLEVMQFIFSSFWVWLGTVILASSVAAGLGGFVHSVRNTTTSRTEDITRG